MTSSTTETDIKPQTSDGEPGDHERFAHYVLKGEISRAMVEGTPCIALCGKEWVPNRKPEDFPVCPDCKKIFDGLEDED